MSRGWLVFNLRKRLWWCAHQAGYTQDVREAGIYSDAEALAIAERMNDYPSPTHIPGEGAGDHVVVVPADGWLARRG